MNDYLIDNIPNIVKAIWDYYGEPRREYGLLNIPETIEAKVAPGITCRMLTDAINSYIDEYPQEAIKHGLVVWFGELMCYKRSCEMDPDHEIWASCIGRAYQKQDDGSFIEMPHELINHKSNVYWRYPFPWAEGRMQGMSEYDIDMNSLAPHRIVSYFPGLPMPKMWSKLFDTRRNGIQKGMGMEKSGGKYYVIEYGEVSDIIDMEVTKAKDGKVYPRPVGCRKPLNHRADHVFNDTAQAPGVHMWFTCRLVFEDINRLNNHSNFNNDRDCLSWPMPQGFTQQVQYDPWQYVEYTQFATHDVYRFDRTGDRAIRYYHQMIQQYFDAIDNGCSPIDFDEYDWCEAMK